MRGRWALPTSPLRRRARALAGLLVVMLWLWIASDAEAMAMMGEGGRDLVTGGIVMSAALAAMIGLGMPLFVIIGVLTVISFAFFGETFDGLDTLDVMSDKSAEMMGQPVLLAIPFFVASGAIMSAGGIAARLVDFARALVGWLPGGLAVATVGSCVFFAAISGSSPVTVIAIGSMMYPQLLKAGYEKRFTLGLVSSAGSLGILIPPSIPMLVYAIVASGSRPIDAAELFLGGVLPGLLIGGLLAGYSVVSAPKSTREAFSMAVLVQRTRDGVWAISLPVLILGGIYSGIFTPTEAAAVSVVYALAVELLIHRDIRPKDIPKILEEAAVTMGTILIIMALAVGLNAFLVEEKIPDDIVAWIQKMDLSPIVFLLIINVFLLAVGALMDSISAILIIAPLLAPIAVQLGIDPVHLGIIFIVNLEIGYLTPPIGINLFVASSVFREPMGEVARGVIPFIGLMMIGLGVVTYVPSVALGPVNVVMRDAEFWTPFPDRKPALADGDAAASEGEGEGASPTTPVQPQVGPTGERVLSLEEMMANATDGEDYEEDEDEDEDETSDAAGETAASETD